MHKTALIVMLCISMFIGGCASLLVSRPSGSSGTSGTPSTSDARVTNQVNAALVREPGISSLDVYVSTYQGVVTLKGYVSSERMKSRAAELANSVAGVQAVRNQIRLR